MVYILSRISVAEAATIINAVITFVQLTLSASLVLLVIYFMPKVHPALAWSSISQTLHSSIWPTLLRSDSSSRRSVGFIVPTVSRLAIFSTALVAVVGVVLPLGLHEGPRFPGSPRVFRAEYLPDTSSIGLATTPNRPKYQYGRSCGPDFPIPCPVLSDASNNTTYTPSTVRIFNSTQHGPFSMQYRRFYPDGELSNVSLSGSSGVMGTIQSFIQRDDIFAIEGLIVDMSTDHPGIGFWNHTMPVVADGGTWSQDVLWLEPLTVCINTNLTADYNLTEGPDATIETYNVTDHGGFYALTPDYPTLSRDGQYINLTQHAYKGAVLSDFFAMLYLNATRNSSFEGKGYPLEMNLTSGSSLDGVSLGNIVSLPLSYLNGTAAEDLTVTCAGFGRSDSANVSNVHVSCGAFLGPPLRTDGGDQKDFSEGSKWRQDIHACASTTRASIQTITFSTNDTSNLHNLRITRRPSNHTRLWGVEKMDYNISSIDLMWGRVDDRFENDSSIWMVRSEGLYLPAGEAGVSGFGLPPGSAQAAHAATWNKIYQTTYEVDDNFIDYRGTLDYAMKAKYQSIVEKDPVFGHANLRNIVWTDIMANNVLGTVTNSTLLASPNHRSIEYDMKFAIPGFVLLAIWVPSFLVATVLVVTRMLKFEYMRQVLDHTSVGRVVVGASLLRKEGAVHRSDESFIDIGKDKTHQDGGDDLAGTAGTTRLTLFLDRKGAYEGLPNAGPPIELASVH